MIIRMATMAQVSNQVSISNARDMHNYCKDNLSRVSEGSCPHFKRTILFVPKEDINRDRGRNGQTLKGTRKIHSIKCVKPGTVASRNRSCFCTACKEGIGRCDDEDYVDLWKVSTLHVMPDVTAPNSDQGK